MSAPYLGLFNTTLLLREVGKKNPVICHTVVHVEICTDHLTFFYSSVFHWNQLRNNDDSQLHSLLPKWLHTLLDFTLIFFFSFYKKKVGSQNVSDWLLISKRFFSIRFFGHHLCILKRFLFDLDLDTLDVK